MLPPAIEVNYSTPFVNSPFIANCTARYPPGVPQSLTWVEIGNSRPFDYTTIVNQNSTSRTIQSVLESVELDDELQYECQAEVDGEYAFTQPGSNQSISLIPIRKCLGYLFIIYSPVMKSPTHTVSHKC